MRLLISLFLILFLLSFPTPSWAQDTSAEITEEQLQKGDEIAEKAFQALQEGDFSKSENYWGELIELFPQNPAVWSNRGNVRLSQNKVESAIADYNQVLELSPEDAMAYNNRGNAEAGKGEYQEAITDYEKAASLNPDFAIARSNAALSHYQVGDEQEALQETRNLVRKYPDFPDVRAALTAMLWAQGKEGEAESNWVAVMGSDARYRDVEWLETVRRWPPKMVEALDNFLSLN